MQGASVTAEGEGGVASPASDFACTNHPLTTGPQPAFMTATSEPPGGPPRDRGSPSPAMRETPLSHAQASASGNSGSSGVSFPSAPAAAAAAAGGEEAEGDSSDSEDSGDDEGSSSRAQLSLGDLALPPSSSLDTALVLVPMERASFFFRGAQKALARDVSIVMAFLKKKLQQQLLAAETPQLQLARIDLVVEKVKNIKRRAEKAAEAATAELMRCSRRLKPQDFARRINWTVLEYLSRNGFVASAREAAVSMQLQDFWDEGVYADMLKVVCSLQQGSTAEAFAWIEVHNAKLRKLNVPAAAAAAASVAAAVESATIHAADKGDEGGLSFSCCSCFCERCEDIRRVLALAAMLNYPPAEYELEAVVKGLPMPHRLKSHLICPVTGEPMDDDNPPMASPEGRLISKKGLALLASPSQSGLVLCPHSANSYPPRTFLRVFLT
ncbi:hypothetical protein Esti_003011 [Eimeria stiedai]